ncbi:unnamed protein product [marine sediment metagenome]|uniref:Major facilitator superfamily (MFS) profile domain-containing protein n=1 Tax=marine sediment metagenome TaxID=412755 RepID=X1H8G8_9ZZZZ
MGGSVHRIPYFMELGFNPQLVSLAFSIDAAGASLMILVSGFLAERIRGSFISAGSFAGFALAVCLMLSASDAWQMFASVLLFGSAVGISMVIQNHLWASYFRRAFLGTIHGITMPAMLLSTALGAPVVVYIYDLTGGYRLGQQLLIAVYIGEFVVMLCARPPCRLP